MGVVQRALPLPQLLCHRDRLSGRHETLSRRHQSSGSQRDRGHLCHRPGQGRSRNQSMESRYRGVSQQVLGRRSPITTTRPDAEQRNFRPMDGPDESAVLVSTDQRGDYQSAREYRSHPASIFHRIPSSIPPYPTTAASGASSITDGLVWEASTRLEYIMRMSHRARGPARGSQRRFPYNAGVFVIEQPPVRSGGCGSRRHAHRYVVAEFRILRQCAGRRNCRVERRHQPRGAIEPDCDNRRRDSARPRACRDSHLGSHAMSILQRARRIVRGDHQQERHTAPR